MTQELYSVEQVAERLGLHVRTVRGYVRTGRLRAQKIGKQYRITRGDLEAFLGPAAAGLAAVRAPEASCIVEVEELDREAAIRLANLAMASANAHKPGEGSLRVETIYDPSRERMKIVVIGKVAACADFLRLIGAWTERRR